MHDDTNQRFMIGLQMFMIVDPTSRIRIEGRKMSIDCKPLRLGAHLSAVNVAMSPYADFLLEILRWNWSKNYSAWTFDF